MLSIQNLNKTYPNGTQVINSLNLEINKGMFGETEFTLITDEKPLKAGIDPDNKLIDRNSDDNLKSVEE